jgi:hypothetical protein
VNQYGSALSDGKVYESQTAKKDALNLMKPHIFPLRFVQLLLTPTPHLSTSIFNLINLSFATTSQNFFNAIHNFCKAKTSYNLQLQLICVAYF